MLPIPSLSLAYLFCFCSFQYYTFHCIENDFIFLIVLLYVFLKKEVGFNIFKSYYKVSLKEILITQVIIDRYVTSSTGHIHWQLEIEG